MSEGSHTISGDHFVIGAVPAEHWSPGVWNALAEARTVRYRLKRRWILIRSRGCSSIPSESVIRRHAEAFGTAPGEILHIKVEAGSVFPR